MAVHPSIRVHGVRRTDDIKGPRGALTYVWASHFGGHPGDRRVSRPSTFRQGRRGIPGASPRRSSRCDRTWFGPNSRRYLPEVKRSRVDAAPSPALTRGAPCRAVGLPSRGGTSAGCRIRREVAASQGACPPDPTGPGCVDAAGPNATGYRAARWGCDVRTRRDRLSRVRGTRVPLVPRFDPGSRRARRRVVPHGRAPA